MGNCLKLRRLYFRGVHTTYTIKYNKSYSYSNTIDQFEIPTQDVEVSCCFFGISPCSFLLILHSFPTHPLVPQAGIGQPVQHQMPEIGGAQSFSRIHSPTI